MTVRTLRFYATRGAAATAAAARPDRRTTAPSTGCGWTSSAPCRSTATPWPRSSGCSPGSPAGRQPGRIRRAGGRAGPLAARADRGARPRGAGAPHRAPRHRRRARLPGRRSARCSAAGDDRSRSSLGVLGHAAELMQLPVPTRVLHDSARDHRRARHRGCRRPHRHLRRSDLGAVPARRARLTSRSWRCWRGCARWRCRGWSARSAGPPTRRAPRPRAGLSRSRQPVINGAKTVARVRKPAVDQGRGGLSRAAGAELAEVGFVRVDTHTAGSALAIASAIGSQRRLRVLRRHRHLDVGGPVDRSSSTVPFLAAAPAARTPPSTADRLALSCRASSPAGRGTPQRSTTPDRPRPRRRRQVERAGRGRQPVQASTAAAPMHLRARRRQPPRRPGERGRSPAPSGAARWRRAPEVRCRRAPNSRATTTTSGTVTAVAISAARRSIGSMARLRWAVDPLRGGRPGRSACG